MDLTGVEMQLVKDSWQILHSTRIGLDIFRRLFEKHPGYRMFFKAFRNTPSMELFQDKAFIRHADSVIRAINVTIANLEDFSKVRRTFEKVGEMHANLNMTADNFDRAQEVTLEVFKEYMPDMSAETKEAWGKVLSLITKIIVERI